MSRPWRIQYEDAIYHIIARGNNQRDIFLNDVDRRDFLNLIGRAAERFKIEVFAFCLMSNHYHLFLRTPGANLASAFQWINATYAARFLIRHQQSGHIFQGRYKSILVVDQAHWQHLSVYLHLNPVRAGLVENPADYEWSSFRDYLHPHSRFSWLNREEILSEYGKSGFIQRNRYQRAFLELSGKAPDFWKDLKDSVVIGSREILEDLIKNYKPKGKQKDVPEFFKINRRAMDPERQLKRLAKIFGVSFKDLGRRQRNFPARLAAYYHLVEHCGMRTSSVANLMKVSPMAVSLGIKRFRQMMIHDPKLKNKIESLSLK